jgi:hypothetical protein
MIREKSLLAEEIVGSGEEWLGGFDVKQLRDLVALEEGGSVGVCLVAWVFFGVRRCAASTSPVRKRSLLDARSSACESAADCLDQTECAPTLAPERSGPHGRVRLGPALGKSLTPV